MRQLLPPIIPHSVIKRGVIGIFLLIVIVATIFYFHAPRRPEPVYQGRSLSQWLERLDDGQAAGISSSSLPSPTPRQTEAATAIRAIGAPALPFLMQDIHATPSEHNFRFRLEHGINQILDNSFRGHIWFSDITEDDRIRWRAAQGLAALGPMAAPAVPELKRLLFTNYFHSSIKEAAFALAAVGPEGIAILTNAPQSNEWSGMCAIWALGQHPDAGANAIPFLIRATTANSEGTACGAIQVLGLLHTDAAEVIPALVTALSNSDASVRSDAVRSLGEFGPTAAVAIPQIKSLANDPEARKALHRIQP